MESLNINSPDFPVFLVADSFNRIVWAKQGYEIGIGEKIIEILKQLN